MKKLILGIGLLAATTTMAQEGYNDYSLSAGLGVLTTRSVYKTRDKYEVLPLIPVNFRYNDFYIDAMEPELGYHLFSEDGMTLSLIGKFHLGYDSDDLKKEYRAMDDRDFDFHIGLRSSYTYDNFEFTSFITQDVSGESDGKTLGMEGKVNFHLIPDKLTFTPAVGMTYMDSSFVDYFYGIKGSEADKINSVKGEYRGAGSVVYHLKGNLAYTYDENLTFAWINGVNFYDSKIERSPIVDKDWGYYTGGTFVYKFK